MDLLFSVQVENRTINLYDFDINYLFNVVTVQDVVSQFIREAQISSVRQFSSIPNPNCKKSLTLIQPVEMFTVEKVWKDQKYKYCSFVNWFVHECENTSSKRK